MKTDEEALNRWAFLQHLSVYCLIVVPILGLLVPVLIWQMKKDSLPALHEHGRMVVNFLLTQILLFAVALPLSIFLLGLPLLVLASALVAICPVIGAIKAKEGILWRYPLTIRFLK